MAAFPAVEYGRNQGGFDLLLASVAKVSGLSPALLLAWSSPLLSGLAFLLLAGSLHRRGSSLWALWVLVLALLYPGPLRYYGALGDGDHHALELFLASANLVAIWSLAGPQGHWRWAPLAALPSVLFLISWAGAPLHLGLALAALLLALAVAPDWSQVRLAAQNLFVFAATVAAAALAVPAVAPSLLLWAPAQQAYLWAAVGASTLGGCLVLASSRVPGTRPVSGGERALFLTLLGAGGWAVSTYLPIPTFLRLLQPRTTLIAEHRPASLEHLLEWYGWLPLLALVALLTSPWLAQRVSPGLIRSGAVFGLVASLLWLGTLDGNYYLSLVVPGAAALLLSRLPAVPLLSAGLVTLLALWSLLPGPGSRRPWLEKKEIAALHIATPGLHQAAAFLRQARSLTSDDRYGLVAPWDLGNLLAATSDTPVGWSQTPSKTLAQLLYTDREEATYQRLRKDNFRFLLLPSQNLSEKFWAEMSHAGIATGEMFDFGVQRAIWQQRVYAIPRGKARRNQALCVKLYENDGSGCGRFREVFASEHRVLRAGRLEPAADQFGFVTLPVPPWPKARLEPLLQDPDRIHSTPYGLLLGATLAPEVKVFEVVTGAVVEGAGPRQESLTVELEIRSLQGPARLVTWTVSSDAGGYFRLRLPHSTELTSPWGSQATVATGPYRIRKGAELLGTLSLTERQIQVGETVPWRPSR